MITFSTMNVTMQIIWTWVLISDDRAHSTCYQGHFLFVQSGRSDQSFLKWNTQVLRTGSGQNGPACQSEL